MNHRVRELSTTRHTDLWLLPYRLLEQVAHHLRHVLKPHTPQPLPRPDPGPQAPRSPPTSQRSSRRLVAVTVRTGATSGLSQLRTSTISRTSSPRGRARRSGSPTPPSQNTPCPGDLWRGSRGTASCSEVSRTSTASTSRRSPWKFTACLRASGSSTSWAPGRDGSGPGPNEASCSRIGTARTGLHEIVEGAVAPFGGPGSPLDHSITAVAGTAEHLWAALGCDGLARLDGVEITILPTRTPGGSRNICVQSMLPEPDGPGHVRSRGVRGGTPGATGDGRDARCDRNDSKILTSSRSYPFLPIHGLGSGEA